MASILNDFFCSVFSQENNEEVGLENGYLGMRLENLEVLEKVVYEILEKLKMGKSPGFFIQSSY